MAAALRTRLAVLQDGAAAAARFYALEAESSGAAPSAAALPGELFTQVLRAARVVEAAAADGAAMAAVRQLCADG